MALLGVFSACSMAFAEEQNYSGTVVTASGEPIMGATVTVTGTTVSTITDMDGKFSLVVPDGYSTVTITYSGMKKQVVSIQREPIMLYASAEAAEEARVKAMKPIKPKRTYKRNAFNLEFSAGSPAGDLSDMISNDAGFRFFELDLGYKHNFSQYIGWHVVDASFTHLLGNIRYDNTRWNDDDEPYHGGVLSATTGIILRTPTWNKMSLFASLNAGAGYDFSGEEWGAVYKLRVGVNLNKWIYLAYKYERFDREVYYDNYYINDLYSGYFDAKLESHMITLGFNF